MSPLLPMRPKSKQQVHDMHAYIPPDVARALDQHMQSAAMPSTLKKYQNSETYVPQHAQAAMAKQLQKTLPGHLKKYAGAYMQQQIVAPHMHTSSPTLAATHTAGTGMMPSVAMGSADHIAPHSPTFNSSTDHFHPTQGLPVEQPVSPAQPGTIISPNSAPAPSAPNAPAQSEQEQPEHVSTEQAFDFIMHPDQPTSKPSIVGGNSAPIRLLIVVGGALILIIIAAVLKSVLASGPDLTSFLPVVQDQQELIHLATNAAGNTQSSLSTSDQNFAATTQLSVTSAQGTLTTYLASIGMKKIKANTLNLKVSSSTDSELTEAATADTYDQTFQEVMQSSLNQYQTDLSNAYQKTTGSHGHAILKNEYYQAQLLVTQLDAATDN